MTILFKIKNRSSAVSNELNAVKRHVVSSLVVRQVHSSKAARYVFMLLEIVEVCAPYQPAPSPRAHAHHSGLTRTP